MDKSKVKFFLVCVMLAVMIAPVMAVVTFNSGETLPLDGNSTADQNPSFYFNVASTLDDPVSCALYINGEMNKSDSATNNTLSSITPDSGFSDGDYVWYINCTDADNSAIEGPFDITIDSTAPTYTWNSPSGGSAYTDSDIISIDVDVSDNSGVGISDSTACNFAINGGVSGFSGTLEYNLTSGKCEGNIILDDPSGFDEGVNNLTVSVADELGNEEVSSNRQIILDNSAPEVLDATEILGTLGYGTIYAADEFFSTAPGNNIINLSINFSDVYTSVENVTFDMTEVCSGVIVIKTSFEEHELWWVKNCTVDQNADFEFKNITITACDEVGNCDIFFRSVMLYNFTTPPGLEGAYEFGEDTTDLSEQTDLADVNYVIDLRVNGSLLPGTPWDGFRKAVLLDFASLNMTSSDISSKLYNLIDAIDISIAAPGGFGTNRIFVDTDAFAELDSGAEITLYNLPFKWEIETEATVLNDTGGTGGITVESWEGNGTTGNLTFSVEGFSGYNVTDGAEPRVNITNPEDEAEIIGEGITINVTANGTGSEISDVIISIGSVDYSWGNGDFNCTQAGSSEIFDCSFNTGLHSGQYEIIVTAYDYGGASPGNDASVAIIVYVNDTEAPEISGASPSGSISYRTSATLSVTTDDNATCRYSNEDIDFANMTAMTDAATTHTQVVTVAASTSYTFYVRCSDWANNTNNESAVISFSVGKKTSSGGGGGGGGSGSVVTYNPSTSQTWTRINPGGTQIMKVVSNEFGVKEISISVINPANNVKILVEKLPGKPASVTKNVTGKVFQYLKIDKTNLNDSDLNGTARIKFQVNQSWLKSNSLEARNIILKRFADNNWQDLKTTLLSTDATYAYYEAETPGFSYFAISEVAVVVPTAPVPQMPEAGETEAGGEETSTEEQPSAQEPPSTTPGTGEVKEEQAGDSGKVKPSASNVLKTVITMLVILLAIGLIVVWVSKGGKFPKMPKIFHKRSKFKTLEGEE